MRQLEDGCWQVRQRRGNTTAVQYFPHEDKARVSFAETWFSAVLCRPGGIVVDVKFGRLDLRNGISSAVDDLNMKHEQLEMPFAGASRGLRCVARCRTVLGAEARTWVVGYCRQVPGSASISVFWRSFCTEHEARLLYDFIPWSRGLFRSDGRIVSLLTTPSDKNGAGTAALLKVRRDALAGKTVLHQESLEDIVHEVKEGELPFVPPERTGCVQMATKALWTLIGRPFCLRGLTSMASYLQTSHGSALCNFDVRRHPGVEGYVALTIDDVPSRHGKDAAMVRQVRSLLAMYGATATFMLMGKYVTGTDKDLVDLLKDGHEFGNHGLVDQPYDSLSYDQFKPVVDECSSKILQLQKAANVNARVRWFRSPWARTSAAMHQVLKERRLTNVLCDSYACCPVIQDGDFIGRFLAGSVRDGSIVVIHMPETCSREWCYRGIEVLLEGLQARGLQAVSLGTLAARAEWQAE